MHTVSGRYGVVGDRCNHLSDVRGMYGWHVCECNADGVLGVSDRSVVTTFVVQLRCVYDVYGRHVPRHVHVAILHGMRRWYGIVRRCGPMHERRRRCRRRRHHDTVHATVLGRGESAHGHGLRGV
jgi:hypothetical protein